jgi:hypothetical protein
MFTVTAVSNIRKGLLDYRTQLSGAEDEGVKAMATMFRNQVRKEFNYQGKGRVYLSRKNRVVRKLNVEAVALGNTIRNASQSGGSRKFLAERKSRLAGVTRRLGRALKSHPQGTELHWASAIGDSPSKDVGTIVYGIQAGVTDGERRVGDVGGWRGWRALHEGGGRLSGARPFLVNALRKVLPKLAGVNVAVVRKRLGFHG